MLVLVRSFVQKLLANAAGLCALVLASTQAPTDDSSAIGEHGLAASAQRHSFLQVLAMVLQLDAPAVRQAQPAPGATLVLEAYLAILRLTCATP